MAKKIFCWSLALFLLVQTPFFVLAGLEIHTDRLKYNPDEPITVNIHPSDAPVELTYADETKDAVGTAEFTAQQYKNKITAVHEDEEADRIIFVTDKDRFAIFTGLSIFGMLNYFLYVVLRKCWGGLI